ncbi:hypothetical protein VTN00DRAFT_8947 [Thermoascus crustaceus]|uniref:uncharacterized protein n=1 Tax=Thermoascus crustaceus TaxID=5088 RepID=UPI003742ED70
MVCWPEGHRHDGSYRRWVSRVISRNGYYNNHPQRRSTKTQVRFPSLTERTADIVIATAFYNFQTSPLCMFEMDVHARDGWDIGFQTGNLTRDLRS